jgi:hypothetical protein
VKSSQPEINPAATLDCPTDAPRTSTEYFVLFLGIDKGNVWQGRNLEDATIVLS